MSLLAAITSTKTTLKPTETIITHLDGRKFKETETKTTELSTQPFGYVVDDKPDNIPAKILDFLYLGSQDCCELETLQEYKIQRVLSVGIPAPIHYPEIQYKYVQCLDLPETNIVDIFLHECLPYLESAAKDGCAVLVHCNAGVSRSSSIVIGFVIVTQNRSYEEALEMVRGARPCVKPNTGFEKQLRKLRTPNS